MLHFIFFIFHLNYQKIKMDTALKNRILENKIISHLIRDLKEP